MLSFCRVQEYGWRTSRTEGRSNIMAYLACLTQSGDDYLAPNLVYGIEDQFDSLFNRVIYRDIADTLYFTVDDVLDISRQLLHKGAKIGYYEIKS